MSKVKSLVKRKKNKTKKPVVLKKHHAKPYRKRHYGALVLSSFLAVVLVTYGVVYRNEVSDATRSARNYISDLFQSSNSTTATISSTYGFSISYDTAKYYSGAVDSATGDLFFGSELSTKRAYEQFRFSSTKTGDSTDISSLTAQYYPNVSANNNDDPTLIKLESGIVQGTSDAKSITITKVKEEKLKISNQPFVKTEWTIAANSLGKDVLKSYVTTYRGSVNGKAFIIKVSKGVTNSSYFDEIINQIQFGEKLVVLNNVSPEISSKKESNGSLLNSMFFVATAKAASAQTDSTELTSAKYSPAVVQIWNLYCMDIEFDGAPFLRDACSGSTGSGFFIGSGGHIATNGHVVNQDPKGIAIGFALSKAFRSSDYRYFDALVEESGILESDLTPYKTEEEKFDFVVNKFYEISDSKIKATNNVSNLLVLLNEKTPDVKELTSLTVKRKEYAEQDSIKRAKLEAIDFRYYDGYVKWRSSDVALIKIEGSNYPVVKTGSTAALTQGSALTILGYPSQASDNKIVEETVSKVTLTSGKVSAIKNAKGSDKKLIETDTTIGHGNSGGPAFDSTGLVVGLATYTSDGSGEGNGVFNYIRDIKDLQDIISKGSISLNTTSTTQKRWEEGLDYFYNARYSKAVKKFQEVKALYSQHSKADEFIASANERIKNGQEVKDFPYLFVGAGVFVALAGVGVAVFVIRRHKHKHGMYLEHVANNGGAAPFEGGVKSITVQPPVMSSSYTQPQPTTSEVKNQEATPATSAAPGTISQETNQNNPNLIMPSGGVQDEQNKPPTA